MSFLMFCFYVLLLLLLYWLWSVHQVRSRLPPGPWPLPVIGNLLHLDANRPQNTMLEWSKIYGPVMTVWLANKPMVMITDYEIMKDALVRQGDQLSARTRQFVFDLFSRGNYGVVMASGPIWKEQRRFSLHAFRNFGVGKNIMEHSILEGCAKMCSWIEDDLGNDTGKAMDVSMLLQLCISNIISMILFGHPFERHEPKFVELKELLDTNMHLLVGKYAFILSSYPWLRFTPFRMLGLNVLKRNNENFMKFLLDEIDRHKLEMKHESPDEEPKDFIMAYLKEMASRESHGEDQSYFTDWQLIVLLADLWIAGMETTVTTLRWGLLAMMINPDIQQKVKQEIDTVIGVERPPSMSDMKEMPYVTATLNEIQRWGNIVPINIPHCNEVDFQLAGYNIPAGIEVVPQISVLNVDPKVFPSPEIFDPERFLVKDNKIEQFNPFSMGKRQCMGEPLARMELFLVFVSIIRQFNLAVVPGESAPDLTPQIGLTSGPKNYQCLITHR